MKAEPFLKSISISSISLFGNNYKQTTYHATENKPH